MKKLTLLCLAGILCSALASGQVSSISELKTEPVTVNTGYSLKLHSTILNEDRTIMISLPEGYEKSTKKYPVLYMLDAQWNFNYTAQNLGWISSPDNHIIPQTIVVGIYSGGDKRTRDLTPTPGPDNKGGGADLLYRFIKEELVPFVDKNYRTYNYRVLGGASYGGLFVMNAFVNDPLRFNAYLSISPSMWWDNQVMLKRTGDFLSGHPNLPTRLYLTMANEGTSMGVDSLAVLLQKYSTKELVWKYDKHPEEIHGTITFKGTWDGMKFLLSDWYYPFINFGTRDNPFAVTNSDTPGEETPKAVKLSAAVMNSYSGLYQDSFGRLLAIVAADNALMLSCNRLPTVTLHPEAGNRFFLYDNTLRNELFLKGVQVRFEFPSSDSLVVMANRKPDCTAKKLTHSPLVTLADEVLTKYVGAYLSSVPNNDFRVTKKGHSLLLSSEKSTYNLYPMSANKFFVLIDGLGLELEFLKDASNNATRVNVTKDGKVMLEAKKTN